MSGGRARRLRLVGTVEHRHEADDLLAEAGDAVLVERGCLRSMAMACPDGCGAVLTVNLDGRAGPAWRIWREPRGLTLFPSVWRDAGCEAHFIVWRDHLIWCDRGWSADEPDNDVRVDPLVLGHLDPTTFRSADEIAEVIGEIPWEVRRAADRLVARGLATSAKVDRERVYRLPN